MPVFPVYVRQGYNTSCSFFYLFISDMDRFDYGQRLNHSSRHGPGSG